jgi:hypothetical protein
VQRRRFLSVAAIVVLSMTLSAPAGASTAPGSLPQTNAEPSFGTALTTSMRELARAISLNQPALATTIFFPENAYLKMKTGVISYPATDFTGRLVAFYRLDIAAYHQALIRGSTTRFLRVNANARLAQWIAPGACENTIGYWHVPGVRLVWQQGHKVVSVAVASLISWRGVWYVVHLGPNPRPSNVGTVDDFENGPGVPGPGGGC